MGAHDLAGRNRVGDARGCSEVVLEHLERTIAVAHEVKARDRDPRVELMTQSHQRRLVVLRALEARDGHDAGSHDLSLPVHILHEQLERPYALGHAVRQRTPFGGVYQARDRVDAERLVAGGRAERDAAPADLTRHRRAQLGQIHLLDRLPHAAVVLGGVGPGGRALLEGDRPPAGVTPALGRCGRVRRRLKRALRFAAASYGHA